jgi:hypothetical protein
MMEEAFTLERQRYVAQELLTDRLRRDAFYEEHHDAIQEGLIRRLSCEVLREQVARHEQTFRTEARATARVSVQVTATVEVPASWFQHLKRDHFPAWWVARWPVRTEVLSETRRKHASKTVRHVEEHTADFTQYAEFPVADIQMPDKYRGPIIMHRSALNTPSSVEWEEESK